MESVKAWDNQGWSLGQHLHPFLDANRQPATRILSVVVWCGDGSVHVQGDGYIGDIPLKVIQEGIATYVTPKRPWVDWTCSQPYPEQIARGICLEQEIA